ncbi:sortase [Sphingobacteriaceae bacterium WQ 2009]|uniref:Sortase n=1 Tax=Rhinopithecimicrobium faecis TaxID=2820698 RepID=A0A8T4HCI7_9SPHI|nr:sortase [Sphingobacteriaceae bacterium WQ 2009]
MKKHIIYNVVLNLAIALLVYSGIEAYRVGNALIVGLSIALLVVVVFFKIALVKQVRNIGKPPVITTKKKKK